MNKNIKILIAAHKKYNFPNDSCYMPIHVGKEGKEELGYIGDNTGDNISIKNPYYCELTGLYWAWKNLDSEYIGLVHYRRHFTNKNIIYRKMNDKFKCILDEDSINRILEKTDIILPKKRKYYIENIYSHYMHTLHVETLDEAKKIIEEKYPEYKKCFEKVMKRTSAHMFNMFIMKKDFFDKYCEWLFSILEELEIRIDPSRYDKFHARYLGRISEILLDVWIEKNNIKYKEVSVISMEKVNWFKKGIAFFKAKFSSKKYEGSF